MAINWVAVLLATLSSFVLGGLWYSVFFGKAWQKAAGLSDETVKGGNKALIFGGNFVLAFISSATFALFLGPMVNPGAYLAGLCAGLCWVTASLGSTYLFERKPLSLFLINGGYRTLQFTIVGFIIGGWH